MRWSRSSSSPGHLLLLIAIAVPAWAQVPSRLVTTPIDESKLITLRGNVHPLAQARYDLGAVSESLPTGRLLLLLNRPNEQESALDQYLHDVHTSGSATYHQWVTPQQFGARFGPADADIQAVSAWLSAKGFQVTRVSKGKMLIEFSGDVGQVNEAFHTQIHRYEVNGELHYANANDPQIPEALAGIVRGISPLHDFRAKPAIRVVGRAHIDPETKKIIPEFDLTGPNGTFYGVGPEDFATQYDLTPLYTAGITGSGKTIGIINDSNVDLSLDTAYRSLFGLSSNTAQVVVDGGDPGVNGDELEAYLDVEVAGSVAPGATVNLYIATFDTLDDPLILAAQRAIEDNQADVLSISFGNCETNLGTSHNAILVSLWQQAAAQGQTVFVSAGDSGSAGCDDPALYSEASLGLAVNGFASTPWDVAVGGTDFYYSDYASGAPSAATLWNSTNDANYGSLKAPLPEQVWNDGFGFDVSPSTLAPLYAGSGGVSSVYSKPAWQTGSGVPSDGQRDLPDVSLFAADGTNLSGYVICMNPGDCTPVNGLFPVTVVGGTSASSPAMAGIMALINQKHGRQGQANYVLYPLAKQVPTAFHDITLGGNNVPCLEGSPDCVLGTSGTDNGQYTMSGYPAVAGYDLASGLGSVDANAVVNNWSKITFLSTITTLQLSSSSFAHGTAVTFTADVTHSSGSETPTGNVAILTNSAVPFGQTQGVLPIGANGSATGSINSLPGGSYQLWASYAGDGVYSGGTSSPVEVTVTPEASSVGISAWNMNYSGTANPALGCQAIIGQTENSVSSGATIYPGTPLWLLAQPMGKTSSLSAATGSVSFTLDSQAPVSVPINVKGIATWITPVTVTTGSHSVVASYSGDASYAAAQSGAFNFSVKQAETILELGPGGVCGTGTTCTAYAGDPIPIEVYLQAVGCLPPTGTVSVSMGSHTQNATLTAAGGYATQILTGVAVFTGLPPGTYPISASYTGDSNYSPASQSAFSISVVAATGARIASTTSVTENSSYVTYPVGTNTEFTVTVTGGAGGSGAPTGWVYVYANGQGVVPIQLAPSGANTASGTSGPEIGDYFTFGANQITAVYTGDGQYQESLSAPIVLMDVENGINPDFTIAAGAPQFVVPKGGSANTAINLGALWGFSGTVNLACTTSSSVIGCSISPNSVSISGPAQAMLTVSSTSAATQAGDRGQGLPWLIGITTLVGGCLLGCRVPSRRKRSALAATALCGWALIAFTACGSGGKSVSVGPPPPQPPTPLVTYNVTVTATGPGGTVHSVSVIVSVQ